MSARERFSLLAPIFLTVCASSASAESLHTEGRHFRDERGGAVFLRGLNVAGDAKVPPFRPIDDPSMFDDLPMWGVNVARLLFTWEAFEPEREQYDASYLEYYRGVVDALHQRGVRVIVDFHQDAFSRFATSGCGEGMPKWAVSPKVKLSTPDNGPSCKLWGIMSAIDGATLRSWNDFYADRYGVRTRYLKLLDTVSKQLGDHPGVLGYDMLNEPGGDERKQLAPLYEDAARVLRENDPDAVLFVSPGAVTSAGSQTTMPRPTFTNFAYAPHYYDAAVTQLHRWFGGSLAGPIGRMATQAKSWDVPLFVGEFGGPAEGANMPAYIDEFYAQLDASLASSAQWTFAAHWHPEKKDGWNLEDFSIRDSRGALRPTYRVRPYPARIAGEPGSFSAGTRARPTVELTWVHVPEQGETRLFAPRIALFGGAPRIETEGGVKCAYESDGLYVRCTAQTAGNKRVRLRRAGGSTSPASVQDDTTVAEARGGDGAPQGEEDASQDDDAAQDEDAAQSAPEDVDGGCTLARGEKGAPTWLALLALLGLSRRFVDRRRRASAGARRSTEPSARAPRRRPPA